MILCQDGSHLISSCRVLTSRHCYNLSMVQYFSTEEVLVRGALVRVWSYYNSKKGVLKQQCICPIDKKNSTIVSCVRRLCINAGLLIFGVLLWAAAANCLCSRLHPQKKGILQEFWHYKVGAIVTACNHMYQCPHVDQQLKHGGTF